jgi:hypothetical protein
MPLAPRSCHHRSASIAAVDDRAASVWGTGRPAERAAIRVVQALFEDANHIYQSVLGSNDTELVCLDELG